MIALERKLGKAGYKRGTGTHDMAQQITTISGRPISTFAFGAMQFGGGATDDDSRAMFDACRNAGINHFDTAFAYTEGQSEQLLGQYIAPLRDDIIVATKVAYKGGAGRRNILDQFETSRARLGLDQVDILYLHRFDPETDLRETFQTLADLKSKALIRYIGVSNFAAWQVMKAQSVAASFEVGIDILQPMYNLVKRQSEVELLPMAIDQGLAVAAYSPLGAGLLSGKYAVQNAQGRLSKDPRYRARYGEDWMWQTAGDLAEVAKAEDIHPATLAIAWVARHAASPMPIISGRNLKQLLPALKAIELPLTISHYKRITALSRAPAPPTDRLEEQ